MRSEYRQKGERRLPGGLAVKTTKETLNEIEKASPGQRFQRLYRKRQQGRHAKAMNVAFNVGGLLVIAVGIATYPIPVIPSEIVILVGLALISQGSLRGAKILDGAEVRLRRWFAPAIRLWRRLPKWARRVLAVLWVVAVSGLSYWAYRKIAD
jgi:uncharacterized membrane protein YbaN (DUF454 family)